MRAARQEWLCRIRQETRFLGPHVKPKACMKLPDRAPPSIGPSGKVTISMVKSKGVIRKLLYISPKEKQLTALNV